LLGEAGEGHELRAAARGDDRAGAAGEELLELREAALDEAAVRLLRVLVAARAREAERLAVAQVGADAVELPAQARERGARPGLELDVGVGREHVALERAPGELRDRRALAHGRDPRGQAEEQAERVDVRRVLG